MHPDEKLFFVVGGTGFYFQALEKGMYPVRAPVPEIKAVVEAELKSPGGPKRLYQELQSIDPEYSLKIHQADHYRLGRAIEMIRAEGRTITAIQKEFLAQASQFPYPLLKNSSVQSREILAQRVTQRTHEMLSSGLIDETLGVLEKGWGRLGPNGSGRIPRGDRVLKEIKSLEWLASAIDQSTLQLAKKQRTWFQRDQEIRWFDVNKSISELADSTELNRLVREFLLS